ncbi:MAG: Ig-like domain-containing protein [Bdellovibrionales bacterium]
MRTLIGISMLLIVISYQNCGQGLVSIGQSLENFNSELPLLNIVVNEDTEYSGIPSHELFTKGDLLVLIETPPSKGKVEILEESTGRFKYIPRANVSGKDEFTMNLIDLKNNRGTPVTVSVNIKEVNDAPEARDQSFTLIEDISLSEDFDIVDPDSEDQLVYEVVSLPIHGVIDFDSESNAFKYTPSKDYNGTDSFKVKAQDLQGVDSNVSTISLSIFPANDPPRANRDPAIKQISFSASNTSSLKTNLAGFDIDGDALEYIKLSEPSKGSLSIDRDGGFIYSANLTSKGEDSFNYKLKDAAGAESEAIKVVINIQFNNEIPVANTLSFIVPEDSEYNGQLSATDADAGETENLIYNLVQTTENGTVNLNADGSFVYKPKKDFYGVDEFQFQAADVKESLSNIAIVNINVSASPDSPIVTGMDLQTQEDVEVSGEFIVEEVDGESVRVTILDDPTLGDLTISLTNPNSFTFKPNENVFGSEEIRFKAIDVTERESEIAVLRLNVLSVNDSPIALDMSIGTTNGSDTNGNLSDKVTDVELDVLTYEIINQPLHGSISDFNPNTGAFVFRPTSIASADQIITDAFSYRAIDSKGAESNSATVSITISDFLETDSDGFYKISTIEDFFRIQEKPGGSYRLTQSIVFEEDTENTWSVLENFSGKLDGAGHSILNLSVKHRNKIKEYYGIFADKMDSAEISNITFKDPKIVVTHAGSTELPDTYTPLKIGFLAGRVRATVFNNIKIRGQVYVNIVSNQSIIVAAAGFAANNLLGQGQDPQLHSYINSPQWGDFTVEILASLSSSLATVTLCVTSSMQGNNAYGWRSNDPAFRSYTTGTLTIMRSRGYEQAGFDCVPQEL